MSKKGIYYGGKYSYLVTLLDMSEVAGLREMK